MPFRLDFQEFCRFKRGYLTSWCFKEVSASTSERCLLTGGFKCRVSMGKSQDHGLVSTEMHAHERCPQAEV